MPPRVRPLSEYIISGLRPLRHPSLKTVSSTHFFDGRHKIILNREDGGLENDIYGR